MIHEKLLSDLITIPSLSGEETEIRKYIENWYNKNGIETNTQGDGLLVHIKGLDSSRAFIINSHMDTVGAGETWTHNPYEAIKSGNKIIGLGASDMKSGITSSMLLGLQMSQKKPPVDVWLTYVPREEVDGSGTKEFVDWFKKEGYFEKYEEIGAIFTEPTSMQEVEHGHRGNYFLIVNAKGPSGHGSRPNEIQGTLAVRKIINFADKLQDQSKKWQIDYPNQYFDPSITVGEMTSISANLSVKEGIAENGKKYNYIAPGSPNKFAETCEATFDIRTTPEAHEQVYIDIKEIGDISDVEVNLLYPEAPAGFTDPNNKLVKIAASTLGNRETKVSLGSADMGFLSRENVSAVILGPGESDQLHVADEYCIPDQIPEAVTVYSEIIKRWAE